MKKTMIYLTIDELAERWKRPVGTLRNWRYKKQGPNYIKNGHQVLYPLDEIVRYETANFKKMSPVKHRKLRAM